MEQKSFGEKSEHPESLGFNSSIPDLERKVSFWEKISEHDLYPLMRVMGRTDKQIDAYQKKRVLQSVIISMVGILLTLKFDATNILYYIVTLGLSGILYFSGVKRIRNYFYMWDLERQMRFARFKRLLIPYLKQNNGNVSLYSVLNKLLSRIDNEVERHQLYTLMTEMTLKPNDISPYLDYARNASGTDNSEIFMSALYDYQQTTSDISALEELGQMANDELMKGIDEIIEIKTNRFYSLSTQIVMPILIVVIGYGVGVAVFSISKIDLNI